MITGTIATRFDRAVQRTDDLSGCWLWTGARTANGYGAIKYQGHMVSVHRMAWTLACGPIPNGLFVCHACDVRHCVRPDHLFLGTHAENMADRNRKGRAATNIFRGMASGRAKLTDDHVRAIRCATSPVATLARKFAVSKQTIRSVRARHTWRHLEATS